MDRCSFDGAMGERRGVDAVPDRVALERLADEIVDGGVDDSRGSELYALVGRVEGGGREVGSLRRSVEALREPVASPDFVGRVLSECERRRGFVSERGRFAVWSARVAAAACLLLVVGVGYWGQRVYFGAGHAVGGSPSAFAGVFGVSGGAGTGGEVSAAAGGPVSGLSSAASDGGGELLRIVRIRSEVSERLASELREAARSSVAGDEAGDREKTIRIVGRIAGGGAADAKDRRPGEIPGGPLAFTGFESRVDAELFAERWAADFGSGLGALGERVRRCGLEWIGLDGRDAFVGDGSRVGAIEFGRGGSDRLGGASLLPVAGSGRVIGLVGGGPDGAEPGERPRAGR